MYLTADSILRLASLTAACGTLGTILYKSIRWMAQLRQQQEEIAGIKKEQCILCYGLFATLDGLKQLGANGNVTAAYQQLEQHLNQSAHDTGQGIS